MAKPLRFRYSPGRWELRQVREQLFERLDANLGAQMGRPWYKQPSGYDARRFEMDDGSLALFCWTKPGRDAPDGAGGDAGPTGTDGGPGGYWLGNTETPEPLWRTDKYGFDAVPTPVSEWAQRELLATLTESEPWLDDYPTLAWYFLPVLCSKDGAATTRRFFREDAAGMPDTTREEALGFYERFLATGRLDADREEMAAKLGTSQYYDRTRMTATMGEFDAAWLLTETGYEVVPEIEVTTDHVIDFRVNDGETGTLVEVTRPLPPHDRAAGTPYRAIRETVQTKTDGQLADHGGGVTLFVDCTSFPDDDWNRVLAERPSVDHRPAVVFRLRPDGTAEGYTLGSVPLDLSAVLADDA